MMEGIDGRGRSRRGYLRMSASWSLVSCVALVALGGCRDEQRLSGLGESCTRTADCTSAGRCVDLVCTSVVDEAPADEAGPDEAPRGFKSLDNLGRAVVDAVRSGDPAQLRALLVTDAEIGTLGTHAELSAKEIERLVSEVNANRESFDERWRKLQEGAGRFGVVLSRIRFIGLGPHRTERRDGIEWLENDLDILVTYDGSDAYRLDVEDCVKTERGWLLADPEVEFELRKTMP